MVEPTPRDLAVARDLAAEVEATETDVTWRKVTALIDRFGAGRLTPSVRTRITAALAEAGLSVKPSFATVQRYETVRLALGDAAADEDDDGRTRTMSHVLPLDEAVRITEWRSRAAPRERGVFDAAPPEGVLSIELDVSHTEPDIAFEALGPLCNGLTETMVAELFTVDPLPKVHDYVGEVRLVSGFSVRAEESERETDDGKAGALVFQLVELLAGDGWLITAWHRSKRHEGAEEIAEGPPLGHRDVYDGVARHWLIDGDSADDLATLILHELTSTYPQAGRVLMSWLEQWELDFHRRFDETERATLIAIRALVAEFEERLVAFERPEVDPGEAWFTALSSDRWATRIRGLVTRTLADLEALKGTIRSSLDLLGVYSAAQHLRLARQQAEQGERLQQSLAIVTSVLLVPTFITSLFGSNTEIPGQGRWWGFGAMMALIVLGAAGTYLAIRPRKSSD